MVSRVWLFALVLVVPLVGFGVAEAIQAHFDSELRSVIRGQHPDASDAKLAEITVDRLCQAPDSEIRELCDTNSNLNLMSNAAVGAGLAGLALLLAIRLAGSLARSSRNLLLLVFKPGLYLTILVLIGLVVVHAAIAMAAIYYGESALVNRIHVGIIGAIGLGAGAGVLAMAGSAFSVVKKAHTLVIGQALSRDEAPQLWQQIESTAKKLDALHPQHLVVGLDPNFFVTEADVTCLNGKLSGRTLYCSLPLARILSADEFTSVIGHELGHFKGNDTKFSERFYPIYRGTAESLGSLQAVGGDGARSFALLPAIAILSYFLECFSVAESRLSRDRELEADKAGASVTSAATIASALVKIHAFSGIWQGLQEAAVNALKEGRVFVNASKTYAEAVVRSAAPEALEGIATTHMSHPTDSHPPLSVRLQSLQRTISDVSASALNVTPNETATTHILDIESREEEISQAYQLILARRLGIDLEAGGSPEAVAPVSQPPTSPAERSGAALQPCRSCGTLTIGTLCPSCAPPRSGV